MLGVVDTRLADIATEILTSLTLALDAEGIDVPERRYTTAGQIAHDLVREKCGEAFIVSWAGTLQGTVGASPQPNFPIRCAMPTLAQFTIALLRCVPTITDSGKAPSQQRLQDSGEAILIDAMTLTDAVIVESLEKSLTGVACSLNGITSVRPIGPFGAIGGVEMSIVVGLV